MIMSDITKPEQPDKTSDSDSAKKSSELYDRFVELSRDAFELSKEKGSETWEKSMEVAREKLSATGEFSAEQGEAFKRYLRRDLEQTGVDIQRLGKEAKESLNPSRLGAGALSTLAKLLHSAGGALISLSEKAENALEYKSGEMTAAGTLTCLSCGHKIQLNKTSEVPICTECQGTSFRKGY
jgi:Zinc-ribbon containing domain